MSKSRLTRLTRRASSQRHAVITALTPRFIGRLGAADMVSLLTACTGVAAALTAPSSPALAARLILFAAIADALDGLVARRVGSSLAGDLFDALADTVAFGVAPVVFAVAVARQHQWVLFDRLTVGSVSVLVAAMLFVGMAVTRLALYTAYDTDARQTQGVPTTLAATVLAAGYLAGFFSPLGVVGGLVVFAYLMSIQVSYPDLYARDAVAFGVVQCGAALLPSPASRWFAVGLLGSALLYTVGAPRYYWRDTQ